MKRLSKTLVPCLFLIVFLICQVGTVHTVLGSSIEFVDSRGNLISLSAPPTRVVSLVPTITEMIFALGAADAVCGATFHDARLVGNCPVRFVGGFFGPSISAIEAADPDVIFLSSLHSRVREHFANRNVVMIQLDPRDLSNVFDQLQLLGRMFSKESEAETLCGNIRGELDLVSKKVAKIPKDRRKRVMRLMGRERVMTPGDDSFQNDLIRAAGGIPPQLGRNGNITEMTYEEWKQFDPQVVYGCGGDRAVEEMISRLPGWKDVEAVRTGNVYYFPCELTCRASVNVGKFAAWLASVVYDEDFASKSELVLEERKLEERPLDIPLPYVRSARVEHARMFDFVSKTLLIEFTEPMRVVSTLEGAREGITYAGNHSYPPPAWSISHRLGFDSWKDEVFKNLGRSPEDTSLLFTGADMKNLSVRKAAYKDMTVYVLATAGVQSNAVRTSMDEGLFYEPGTINILVLTNLKLSPRAMTRAVITVTEAKTAALQDMDIRSTYNPAQWQATGTGTDEVLVVEGRGVPVDNTGGHSKLGELIAKAVYEAVTEAVGRQNGLFASRNVFQRIQERHIDLYGLLSPTTCAAEVDPLPRLAKLQEILLHPRYAAFVESALAISDARERGLAVDLGAFELWSHSVAEEISGEKIDDWHQLITSTKIPPVLGIAINGLLNGIDASGPDRP